MHGTAMLLKKKKNNQIFKDTYAVKPNDLRQNTVQKQGSFNSVCMMISYLWAGDGKM